MTKTVATKDCIMTSSFAVEPVSGLLPLLHYDYRERYEKSEVEALVWRCGDGVDHRMCDREAAFRDYERRAP